MTHDTNSVLDGLDRRTFLVGTGGLAGALALPVGPVSSQVDAEDAPDARPILGDIDGDERFSTVMHLAADPAGRLCGDGAVDDDGDDDDNGGDDGEDDEDDGGDDGDRGAVVHASSDGEATTDYAACLVNVEAAGLTLGEAAEEDDEPAVSYDYFQGPENANSAPDEAFVVVDPDEDDDEVTVAFLSTNDGVDPDPADVDCEDDDKQWETRDVSAELRGEAGGWRDAPISRERFESGEPLLPLAIALRDEDGAEADLVEALGEDAPLLGVGFGKGSTMGETVSDVYFDDLVVGEETYAFPAAVPVDLDAERRGSGAVRASFGLAADEEGLSVDDVDERSVRLHPVGPLAPPVDGGVGGRGVQVSEGEVRATFPAGQVDAVFGDEVGDVLVAGEFDVEGRVVAFVGTDSV